MFQIYLEPTDEVLEIFFRDRILPSDIRLGTELSRIAFQYETIWDEGIFIVNVVIKAYDASFLMVVNVVDQTFFLAVPLYTFPLVPLGEAYDEVVWFASMVAKPALPWKRVFICYQIRAAERKLREMSLPRTGTLEQLAEALEKGRKIISDNDFKCRVGTRPLSGNTYEWGFYPPEKEK